MTLTLEDQQASRKLLDIQMATSWSLREEFSQAYNIPHILDVIDTLFALLSDDELSISRIADGELGLMTGVALPTAGFQGYDLTLRRALYTVLQCNKKKCKVALPKWFIYKSSPIQAYKGDLFSSNWAHKAFEGRYFDFFRSDYLYLDACMSVPRAHYGSFGDQFLDAYYQLAKKLIIDKDIVLVTGDTRYKTMEHRLVYETAKSLTVVKTPVKEAWETHLVTKESILKANPSGDKTVILCCGPMASVLACELSDYMRCLDLGHMLVDYNLYKKGYGIGNFWH